MIPELMPGMILMENIGKEPRAVSIHGEWKGWAWKPINGKWVSFQKMPPEQMDSIIEQAARMNPCPLCGEIKIPGNDGICENPDCPGWLP